MSLQIHAVFRASLGQIGPDLEHSRYIEIHQLIVGQSFQIHLSAWHETNFDGEMKLWAVDAQLDVEGWEGFFFLILSRPARSKIDKHL